MTYTVSMEPLNPTKQTNKSRESFFFKSKKSPYERGISWYGWLALASFIIALSSVGTKLSPALDTAPLIVLCTASPSFVHEMFKSLIEMSLVFLELFSVQQHSRHNGVFILARTAIRKKVYFLYCDLHATWSSGSVCWPDCRRVFFYRTKHFLGNG